MRSKKLLTASLAAVLAATSTSIVASAASAATTNKITGAAVEYSDPTSADKNFVEHVGTPMVTKTDNSVTVKFSKAKTAYGTGKVGDKDPVHLVITTDIANTVTASKTAGDGNFTFTSGYGFDVDDHLDFNFSEGKIKLWLPSVLTNDSMTIGFKVGTGAEQTFTINYEYTDDEQEVAPLTVGDVTIKNTFTKTPTITKSGSTVTITLKEAVAESDNNSLFVSVPVTAADGKTRVKVAPSAANEVAVYLGNNVATNCTDEGVYTVGIALNATGAGSAPITYREHNGTALGEAKPLVTINVVSDIEAGGDEPDPTPSTPTFTPATPVEPVAPTTSGSTTSTTTSDTTSSAAATIAPVEVDKVEAEVKVGETATVKAEGLGDVTVAVDKDDANLAGAKVEFAATNTEKTVKDNIDKAVGTAATEETKALATAAVEAVKKGDAVALDIAFTKDGKEVQPGKDVTVTVPLPEALKDAEKVYVYHVSDKGIEDVSAKCSIKDGTLTITNNAFSPYIISKVELKTAGEATTSGNSTTSASDPASNPNTGVALAVAPIVLAGAAVAIVSVKRRK